MSRQDYTVVPAHRLDESDERSARETAGDRRPRLRVVHPEDTVSTLAARSTWDEWSDDYSYDDEPTISATTNHYARAYSTHPRKVEVSREYEPPIRRRSMRAQRRVMFTRLVMCAAVLTIIAFFSGSSLVVDVAALSWFSVVIFVALALFAVSQGYLSDSSLPLRLPQRRSLATVEPLYHDLEEGYTSLEGDIDDEFYEPVADQPWQREPERRRAFG
ncbi:MAG: hypothetical protein WCA31_01405 [Acidimicrobiales bacterium]